MSLTTPELEYICKLVLDRSAILLEATKEYLIISRLEPLAKKEGIANVSDLIKRLQREPFNGLHGKVVEAMTTNETSFFRDFHPFESFRKLALPEIITKRQNSKEINIWCAACSSGQEPYSLMMLIRENFPALSNWTIRVICTDISKEMLARAQSGVFSQFEVNRGLPASLLVKYFQQQGHEWKIKDDLKKNLEFKEVNLASTWPNFPNLDFVFIRNVMIYFDIEVKKKILSKIRNIIRPDGFLVLGGAETTINLDDSFDRVMFDKTGFYRLKGIEKTVLAKAA